MAAKRKALPGKATTIARKRAPRRPPPEQPLTTSQRLGSVIKSCRDTMRKDKGLNGDLDRLPQLTWMMFLKFLDDLEQQDEVKATLAAKPYVPLIPKPYRWRDWAADPNGITGAELLAFINQDEAVLPTGKDVRVNYIAICDAM